MKKSCFERIEKIYKHLTKLSRTKETSINKKMEKYILALITKNRKDHRNYKNYILKTLKFRINGNIAKHV
jgi:hypothetical protein